MGEDYRTSRDVQDKPRREIRCYNCGEQGKKLKKDEKRRVFMVRHEEKENNVEEREVKINGFN